VPGAQAALLGMCGERALRLPAEDARALSQQARVQYLAIIFIA